MSKTSGILRDKGMYYLPEDLNSKPAFTAWQYYVFDKPLQSEEATYEVNDPRIQSFDDAKVPDGGFVVWRLCKILDGPNPMPTRYLAMTKQSKQGTQKLAQGSGSAQSP